MTTVPPSERMTERKSLAQAIKARCRLTNDMSEAVAEAALVWMKRHDAFPKCNVIDDGPYGHRDRCILRIGHDKSHEGHKTGVEYWPQSENDHV
jgi:hypothetical protein